MTFKNGFTFEFYCKLNKWLTDSYNVKTGRKGIGYFCKADSLYSGDWRAMRFGLMDSLWIGDFSNIVAWSGVGEMLSTYADGDIRVASWDDLGYIEGDEFYMTVIYRVNNGGIVPGLGVSGEENLDVVEYYLNGSLKGYTYYSHDAYMKGSEYWDSDGCEFFIGAVYFGQTGAIYNFKGDCYTTRLYYNSLTPEQIKLNYELTLKYRDSFKNE